MATEIILGFQDHTRAALPAWGSLLYIYAIFLVPTFFTFIVGTNLLVWSASRINYVFIFGKDPTTFLHMALINYQSWMLERVSITENTSRWVTGRLLTHVRMLTSTHCRYLAFY